MLRKWKRFSALALCLVMLTSLLTLTASASYDIYVNAKDGIGLNLRTGPGTEYEKVRSQPIPMYTRLSISQTQDSAAGLPWGYTSYQGDTGWVCLVETTTYDPSPKQTAYTAANYDIYVNAKDGLGLNIRSGPGTDYSKLRANPIPMYTKLHISQTTQTSSGQPWGYTSYEGISGWVCLVETTTYDPAPKAPAAPAEPATPAADTGDPLAAVSYIGDRAACKMDAAMARAYAKAIANQPATNSQGGTLQAVLVDAGRDGYPLLMTTYLITANGMDDECSIPTIWEYKNGKAVAHDFKADTDLPSPIQMATDTIAEGNVLRVDSNGGGGVDPVQGSLYYAVNKAQLTLLHTSKEFTDSHTYELDGKGYPSPHAVAAKLGWADSLDNASLTTNGSTLFLDCITSDGTTAGTALNAYADTAAPEASDRDTQDPETDLNPPPMERTSSIGSTIALGIIIALLLAVVILFVVMITKLKKKR